MPVLLVLDVTGQAQSAAAVVKGCATYDPRLSVAGVIVNRVGSERHRRLVVDAIEAMGIPVLGALPRNDKVALPERHLGLVQAGETHALEARLEAIADFVETHVDCGRVLALAGELDSLRRRRAPAALRPPGQRIALARDAAFSFIYPHLLHGWRAAGAEIVPFSPLADEPPPADCDLCWLPGGYPELHAGRLAAAARFREGLRRFAETRPVHGECGGYMALGESLIDAAGVAHPMAGLLGVETSFAKRRMTLGYREARIAADCALGTRGHGPARPRVPLRDNRRDRQRRPVRPCSRRLWLSRRARRFAPGSRHRLVLSRDRRGVIRARRGEAAGSARQRGQGALTRPAYAARTWLTRPRTDWGKTGATEPERACSAPVIHLFQPEIAPVPS